MDVVRGLAQAAANAYDGALTEDGEALKVGLQREEGNPILDKRVLDGFGVIFYGPMMCIKYHSEVQLKEVYANGFESDMDQRMAAISSFLKKENRKVTGKSVTLTKEGEIFTFSEKTGYFKLGPKTIIVPEETNIHQNYPNPFNPLTTIIYDIGLMDGLSQNVSITIYNLLGQRVKTLIENKDQIGQFKVQWNGQDKFGQIMASGIYFVQLTTQTGIVKNKKMMLLR